ncbi:hypothetical protein LCL95_08880 [Bacillus timonensis]|nr:hypothetical protein [Bacillus timonensis]
MGYIMPVNHEQYTQYSNRLTPYKFDDLPVEKIKRLDIQSRLNGQNLFYDGVIQSKKQNKVHRHLQIEQKLTGKGRHFDEWI